MNDDEIRDPLPVDWQPWPRRGGKSAAAFERIGRCLADSDAVRMSVAAVLFPETVGRFIADIERQHNEDAARQAAAEIAARESETRLEPIVDLGDGAALVMTADQAARFRTLRDESADRSRAE